MYLFRIFFIVFVTACFGAGCATNGATPQAKRQAINKSTDDTLAKLLEIKPHVRSQITGAPGYAVFSNANINVIFASFGGGHGIVKNNTTGSKTYMKMGEIGLGLGAGVKDYRLVMVFDSNESMNRFISEGWVFGAQADAAIKASTKGAAAGGETVINGITIYQLTESGLALQATIKGTKFWKDRELN